MEPEIVKSQEDYLLDVLTDPGTLRHRVRGSHCYPGPPLNYGV
jgi:hypothetical protein